LKHVQVDGARGCLGTDANVCPEGAAGRIDSGLETGGGPPDDPIELARWLADERLAEFLRSRNAALARERSMDSWEDSAAAIESGAAAPARQKLERRSEIADSCLGQPRCVTDQAPVIHPMNVGGPYSQREAPGWGADGLPTQTARADVALGGRGLRTAVVLAAKQEENLQANVLGMVTHDLRNPLLIIALNAQCIAEQSREPSIREQAEEVTHAAKHMARLLADLLDITGIESGIFRITKRSQDVGDLMDEILRSYRPLFASRGLNLLGERLTAPVVASFDRDRIMQVMSNLLGNAMKFLPPNGTIALSLEPRVAEVEFVLRDNGPGMAATKLAHIFERFFQIDSSARRGLGLGLYICDKIVAAHGGRIWVESELGKGTTFRFTVPTGDGR
jgi:signal transduction histidine kinase